MSDKTIPTAFIWRRLHSLTGAWLVVFIIFHLLTNSQAALPFGGDGNGFIHSVNAIHEFPYLNVIEILILAVPIIVHLIWGIKYVRSAEYNSFGNTGHTPYLPEYARNRAYTWQRITAWLLVLGVIAHVVHMRFIEYPTSAVKGDKHEYMVRVSLDDGLYTLAERLGVRLYTAPQVAEFKTALVGSEMPVVTKSSPERLLAQQAAEQERGWVAALEKRPLHANEVMAVAPTFGTAELLMVRDTFKMPLMLVLYTLLVLATCYHAFNGLWTFMIKWGVTLSERSQRLMRMFTTLLMLLTGFLGLAAIWLTYWINLKS